MTIDARTRLLGVVGHPVAHSLSPTFWNEALKHEGVNAAFLAFDVEPADFPTFVEGMSAAGARGLNVTMPHKAAAFEASTERSTDAKRTNAVNVLVIDRDEISGHNTDVIGVRGALDDLGLDVKGKTALVIGAGGAGRAAAFALTDAGAQVVVANRTRSRAEGLAQAAGGSVADWDDLDAAACRAELIVQTTTVGLDGKGSVLTPAALDKAAGQSLEAVLDVVYRPGETPLVLSAKAAGLKAADGLGMLVHQAAAAWELFFSSPGPLDVMRRAAWLAAARIV